MSSDELCQDEEVASLWAIVDRQREELRNLVMERNALKAIQGIEAARMKRLERELMEALQPQRRRATDR
jgi:hypothetical protein